MRDRLFYVLVAMFRLTVQLIHSILTATIDVGEGLIHWVHPEKAEYYAARNSQIEELSELSVLAQVEKAKQQAIEQKAWCTQTQMVLNEAGNALIQNFGWSVKAVNQHMAKVVEGGPEGYGFMPSDTEEDEDDE